MMIVHPLFEKPIEFKENEINVLVVEEPKTLANMIFELIDQSKTNEGSFVLSEKFEPISISKNINIISDLFTIDINQRSFLTKLYADLEKISMNHINYEKTLKIHSEIICYISNISQLSEFPITYSDQINIGNLFKCFEVKIDTDAKTLIEKIIEYIQIYQKFTNIKLFIFINIKCFLSKEDIYSLYKFVFYNKINIFLIESHLSVDKFEFEKYYIIDKDLCSIF